MITDNTNSIVDKASPLTLTEADTRLLATRLEDARILNATNRITPLRVNDALATNDKTPLTILLPTVSAEASNESVALVRLLAMWLDEALTSTIPLTA